MHVLVVVVAVAIAAATVAAGFALGTCMDSLFFLLFIFSSFVLYQKQCGMDRGVLCVANEVLNSVIIFQMVLCLYGYTCMSASVCVNEMTSISLFFSNVFRSLSFFQSFFLLWHIDCYLISSLHPSISSYICAYDEFSYVCTVHAEFDADSTPNTPHNLYWALFFLASHSILFFLFLSFFLPFFVHMPTFFPLSDFVHIYFGTCVTVCVLWFDIHYSCALATTWTFNSYTLILFYFSVFSCSASANTRVCVCARI